MPQARKGRKKMKKSKFLAKLLAGVMLVTSLGAVNVSAISQASTANRENNVITEFGNTTAIAGLTYCDSVGYNSTSSVRYTKTADENTADTNLVMPENLYWEGRIFACVHILSYIHNRM